MLRWSTWLLVSCLAPAAAAACSPPLAASTEPQPSPPLAADSWPEETPTQAGDTPAAAADPAASLHSLEVQGFLPALLFVPAGVEERSLVVAAHGAGGAPEWECEYWRRLTQEQSFVLCLRGTSLGTSGGYYYKDQHALEAELIAAEQAARRAQPRIRRADAIYAGFSQGSSMGSAIIAKHGAAFPYLALIEGFERWNIPRARTFARSGGKRVLFACGTTGCNTAATESARWLEKGGVAARVEYAAGAGHTPVGAVMQRVEQALPWLLTGRAD